MKRRHTLLVFASIALFCFGPGGVAEAHSSSLSETLEWLKETIATKATNGGKGPCASVGIFALPCPWHYEAVNFSGCEVSWVFIEPSNAQRGFESIDETTMPLWEEFSSAPFASSGGGEIWKVGFQLKDFSSQKSPLKITLRLGATTIVKEETRSFAEIHFGIPGADNKDTAERVAEGFSHAIHLCQRRKPKN